MTPLFKIQHFRQKLLAYTRRRRASQIVAKFYAHNVSKMIYAAFTGLFRRSGSWRLVKQIVGDWHGSQNAASDRSVRHRRAEESWQPILV